MSSPDSDLVVRCRSGDEEAFRLLVQRHQRQIYSLIWRMVKNDEDARDLTQETFVKTFSALHQFDLNRTFSFWINRIASNAAIDFLRKRRPSTVQIQEEFVEDPDGQGYAILSDDRPLPDRQLEMRQSAERLSRLVERLPDHYRIVILHRHAQQRSLEEIAELLGLPLGTVKARLSRAHGMLRTMIQKQPKIAGDDWPSAGEPECNP